MRNHKAKCKRCRKNTYRTYEMGKHALSRLPPTEEGRVYWCPVAGGYHLSSRTKAEVDRKRGKSCHGRVDTPEEDRNDSTGA